MNFLNFAKNSSISQSPLSYQPSSTVETSTSHFAKLFVSGHSSGNISKCKASRYINISAAESPTNCANCMFCKSIERKKLYMSQLTAESNNNLIEKSVPVMPVLKPPFLSSVARVEGIVCSVDQHTYYVWSRHYDSEGAFSRQAFDVDLSLGQWVSFKVKRHASGAYDVSSLEKIDPKFPTKAVLGVLTVTCLVHVPAEIHTRNCLTVKSEISAQVLVGKNQRYLSEQAKGQEIKVLTKLRYRFYEGEICGFWEIDNDLQLEKDSSGTKIINEDGKIQTDDKIELEILPIEVSSKTDDSIETINIKHNQVPSLALPTETKEDSSVTKITDEDSEIQTDAKTELEILPIEVYSRADDSIDIKPINSNINLNQGPFLASPPEKGEESQVLLKVGRGVVCSIQKEFCLINSREFEIELKMPRVIGFLPLGQWINFVAQKIEEDVFKILIFEKIDPCFPTMILSSSVLVKCSVCFPFKLDASRRQTLKSDVSGQVLLGKAQDKQEFEGKTVDALLRYNNGENEASGHWEIKYIFTK